MAKITDELKEQMGDLLSEESLHEIEKAFNDAVEQRSQLTVEAALAQQDEEHANKVGALLEAIDTDHTKKLNNIVKAINENHTAKLVAVVEKYQNEVGEGASTFKTQLVESVSNYLDLYLEKVFPADMLEEAVNNKRSEALLGELRKVLAVDMALAKDEIKDAIVDGKKQIDTKSTALNESEEKVKELSGQVEHLKAQTLLKELSGPLSEEKRTYVNKVLGDKSAEFIQENFQYTVDLFDKQANKALEQLKEEAQKSVKGNVDPVVEKPTVIEESGPVVEENDDLLGNAYMGELSKY